MNEKAELLPLKGKELKCVEYLVGMESRIAESGDALRDRLRLIPNGWRNFRLIFATLDRLLTDLYDTLPLKSRQYLRNIIQDPPGAGSRRAPIIPHRSRSGMTKSLSSIPQGVFSFMV